MQISLHWNLFGQLEYLCWDLDVNLRARPGSWVWGEDTEVRCLLITSHQGHLPSARLTSVVLTVVSCLRGVHATGTFRCPSCPLWKEVTVHGPNQRGGSYSPPPEGGVSVRITWNSPARGTRLFSQFINSIICVCQCGLTGTYALGYSATPLYSVVSLTQL